jgi:hypothetical protein
MAPRTILLFASSRYVLYIEPIYSFTQTLTPRDYWHHKVIGANKDVGTTELILRRSSWCKQIVGTKNRDICLHDKMA